MKNLLIVTSSFPHGGGEGFLIDELEALGSISHVVVAPLFPRGNLRKIPSNKIFVLSKRLFNLEIASAFILEFAQSPANILYWTATILFKSRNFSTKIKNLLVIPKAAWIARYIKANKVDHIHCHWAAYTATAGMIAADISRTPWSMTCHRWDIYHNDLLQKKFQLASFVRFISARGRDDAFALTGGIGNLKIIHMGVHLVQNSTIKPLDPGAIGHICCAANLIPVKGHKYLLRAIKILKDKGITTRLHLFGDGQLKQELAAICREMSIEDDVFFHGQIEREELLELYRQRKFQLFVLYSTETEGGQHEGIPVSIMEAMNYGIVSIASDTGSIAELLPPDALVKQCSPIELASKIESILSNDSTYQSMYAGQRDIVRNWSATITSNQLLDAISIC